MLDARLELRMTSLIKLLYDFDLKDNDIFVCI